MFHRRFSEYLGVLLYMQVSNQCVPTRPKKTVTKFTQTSLTSTCIAVFWLRTEI